MRNNSLLYSKLIFLNYAATIFCTIHIVVAKDRGASVVPCSTKFVEDITVCILATSYLKWKSMRRFQKSYFISIFTSSASSRALLLFQ
jgi:hypothetical protein